MLPRSSLLRYCVAVVAVGVALFITLQVGFLAEHTPFALFFAAVMFSTWYGGRNPGLAAIALSALASDYFIIPPLHTFSMDRLNYLEEGAFVAVGLFINS